METATFRDFGQTVCRERMKQFTRETSLIYIRIIYIVAEY